jgi:Tfp pilus assembly protein PilZ
MRFVTCAFWSAEDFLASYSVDYPEGALYCRTRSVLELDEDVLVEVDFPDLADRTLVRGWVVSVDRGSAVLVRLNAGDAHRRDFLIALARGDIAPSEQVSRGHRRIPAALPVTCRIDEVDDAGERVYGHTRDVGGGGVFVHSPAPPATGTRVSLVLGPTRSGESFLLDGRVAWIRRDARSHGFGVHFDPRGDHDGRRLRTLIRRSWERGRLDLGWTQTPAPP